MLLAINTATEQLALALIDEGRVIAEAVQDVGLEHSEAIFRLLESVFAWITPAGKADLKALAVAVGPGGFTGVRIGLAAAKTIAQVRGLPVYGIETLPALAFQLGAPGLIVPMLDARRGLVFAGLYQIMNGEIETLEPGRMAPLTEWTERLQAMPGPVSLLGEGAMRHRAALALARPDAWIPADHAMVGRAAAIGLLAERRWRAGEPSDGATLAPLYLREPQAVVNWEAAQRVHPDGAEG